MKRFVKSRREGARAVQTSPRRSAFSNNAARCSLVTLMRLASSTILKSGSRASEIKNTSANFDSHGAHRQSSLVGSSEASSKVLHPKFARVAMKRFCESAIGFRNLNFLCFNTSTTLLDHVLPISSQTSQNLHDFCSCEFRCSHGGKSSPPPPSFSLPHLSSGNRSYTDQLSSHDV